jgi:hypothetical protein
MYDRPRDNSSKRHSKPYFRLYYCANHPQRNLAIQHTATLYTLSGYLYTLLRTSWPASSALRDQEENELGSNTKEQNDSVNFPKNTKYHCHCPYSYHHHHHHHISCLLKTFKVYSVHIEWRRDSKMSLVCTAVRWNGYLWKPYLQMGSLKFYRWIFNGCSTVVCNLRMIRYWFY